MIPMRNILERCLALCESMNLEDLQKYPEASYLIPMLHDALEQEEKCTHVFVEHTCIGCGFTQKF